MGRSPQLAQPPADRCAAEGGQRTGAGAPGSVDNPDLVVEVLGRTVVARTDVGTVGLTVLGAGPVGAGTLWAAVVEGVGAGGPVSEEHAVAAAASATATSRRRLNEQAE